MTEEEAEEEVKETVSITEEALLLLLSISSIGTVPVAVAHSDCFLCLMAILADPDLADLASDRACIYVICI